MSPIRQISPMAPTSLYRTLPAARRIALLTRLFSERKDVRALYIQRLVSRGGGFRAVTLNGWPVDRLAREVARLNVQTADDEIDLLHALYVDLEPAIQIRFLETAAVAHTGATIDEGLEPPFASAEAVARAATVVREEFGEDGLHYLRTIARYNPSAWPGLVELVAALPATPAA